MIELLLRVELTNLLARHVLSCMLLRGIGGLLLNESMLIASQQVVWVIPKGYSGGDQGCEALVGRGSV